MHVIWWNSSSVPAGGSYGIYFLPKRCRCCAKIYGRLMFINHTNISIYKSSEAL